MRLLCAKKELSGLGSSGIKTETTLHEADVHPFSYIKF